MTRIFCAILSWAFLASVACPDLAFAASKVGQSRAPVPTKNGMSRLTDGECEGLGGSIKGVATAICGTGKACDRVNQDGVVIRVGCIDDIKH